jgi:RNA-directed DNA polymerase
VSIPKGKGAGRPLGIPAVRCRVAQEGLRALMAPLFAPTVPDSSHGFRRRRRGPTARAQRVESHPPGYWVVVEAARNGFFASLPHPLLLELVACEMAAGNILRLMQLLLQAGVLEEGEGRPTGKGTPQGGGLSPGECSCLEGRQENEAVVH